MNLSECLNTADTGTLRAIADYYDLPCSRHSKMSLLQEILYTFKSRTFIEGEVARWQAGREGPMLRLCLEQRRTFSTEELLGMFHQIGGENVVKQAVREGWLYPTTRLSGRLMYCIPEELHQHMRGAIVERFCGDLARSEEGPLLYQEEGTALSRDLDVFLEYVRHHDVLLTTDGSMYKRNAQQVFDLLEISESPLQGGWRFGYGRRFHEYPDRFALLYDYAYHARLICEASNSRLEVTEACASWNQLDTMERQRALLRFYVLTYRRPIKRLPQIAQLVAHAATRWTDSVGMMEALGDLIEPYYYDDEQHIWRQRILKMLMHLGVVRVGEDENQREWFQITEIGQQLLTPDAIPGSPDQSKEKQRILIVQPNFEVVVTAEQPMVTAELALFTELRQAGVVRVYRITEDSIQKGMTAGKSLSKWLEFLQTFSQTPVPGNVERTLEEWERAYQLQRDSDSDSLTS